jgi:hypothetical protein
MSAFDDNPFGQASSPQVTFGVKNITSLPVNTTINPSTNPFNEEIEGLPKPSNEVESDGRDTTRPLSSNPIQWSAPGNNVDLVEGASIYETRPHIDNGSNEGTVLNRNTPNIFTIDIDRRNNDLEKEYESLEDTDTNGIVNTSIDRRNNWPPFPKWTKIKPCFYHDIDVDIPSHYQRTVKNLYRLWVAYVLVMSLNLIDGLIALFIGFSDDNGKAVGLALLYWAFCIPSSFLCWFRPAYKAFRNDGSIRFMIFFLVFFAQCGFTTFVALGIGELGAFGWVNGIVQCTIGEAKHIFLGICCILTGLCSTAVTIGSVFMVIKIHKLYRYSGNSMAKAKNEITSEITRNKNVQDAVKAGAAEIVTSQLQN